MLQIGMVPDEVRVPDIDETPTAGELPRRYCIRMAREKALALPMSSDEVVLCADTSVYAGRRILDKPDTETEARQSLLCLSGRRHRVVTAVAVRTSDSLQSREVVSVVRMKRLSKEELAAYLATGEWRGKAGGYAIQGKAGALVPWIRGSYSAIVGLPLSETETLLRAHGIMPGHAR